MFTSSQSQFSGLGATKHVGPGPFPLSSFLPYSLNYEVGLLVMRRCGTVLPNDFRTMSSRVPWSRTQQVTDLASSLLLQLLQVTYCILPPISSSNPLPQLGVAWFSVSGGTFHRYRYTRIHRSKAPNLSCLDSERALGEWLTKPKASNRQKLRLRTQSTAIPEETIALAML